MAKQAAQYLYGCMSEFIHLHLIPEKVREGEGEGRGGEVKEGEGEGGEGK